MITLDHVSKKFGKTQILHNASLRISPKEWITIAGTAGSGKTTLLRLLLGIDRPDSGSVEADDVALHALPESILQLYRSRIGVITHPPLLERHATLWENVVLPLQIHGVPDALIERNATDLLKRLGLLQKAHQRIEEVSESERQLACLARAMIASPVIFLADEPFLSLDTAQRDIAVRLLSNMQKRGTTIVLLTRDLEFARTLPGRVVLLEEGMLKEERKIVAEEKLPSRISSEKTVEDADQSLDAGLPSPHAFPRTPNTKKIRITSIGSAT